MYRGNPVVAVIAAGGLGLRYGADGPKQFLKLGALSMLGRALLPFLDGDIADAAVIAVPEGMSERTAEVLENDFGDTFAVIASETDEGGEFPYVRARYFAGSGAKPILLISGGADRTSSVHRALEAMKPHKGFLRAGGSDPTAGYVLIHDAARPYVSEDLIKRVMGATHEHGAAIPSIFVKETVYRTESSELPTAVKSVLDREGLAVAQTPQGFAYEALAEAMADAVKSPGSFTDDGSAFMAHGGDIYLVEGDRANVKVTTEGDLAHLGANYRVGAGFDAHAFGPQDERRPLMLGGVRIPFDRSLIGHSDADVMTHALMDAILGAIAKGDIGEHFPASDERYRDASSIGLLKRVVAMMKEDGYSVVNADLTLVAEAPKLAPHRRAVIESIAKALGVAPALVSAKATTTERLGFTGREEGLAAEAVVMLKKD